ncbi:MAG: hypothetical protein J7K33_09845 [Candidatus Marinimicrobia bacterium]|nr:hypothetical protein [Candidatus Neomarinimicrobiota bacterium]
MRLIGVVEVTRNPKSYNKLLVCYLKCRLEYIDNGLRNQVAAFISRDLTIGKRYANRIIDKLAKMGLLKMNRKVLAEISEQHQKIIITEVIKVDKDRLNELLECEIVE